MPKIFSFVSWNVEKFSNEPGRVDRVVGLLAEKDPDVFALYEVMGKQVFNALMSRMPTHSFSITENTVQSNMEILVGVRNTITSFVTQREEFRSKVPTLRPGALATLQIGGKYYAILFVHPKSFKEPRDWGLRDDMFQHVASLKRILDKDATAGDPPAFICLGDLNTMGLSAAYNDVSDLKEDQEIQFLEKRMARVKMRRLSKTHEASWWNGKDNYQPAKLDHVFAAEHLKFKKFGDSEVEVIGWPQEPAKNKMRDWIENYSDHALLYGEIIA